ncbi:quinone oxidoreductase family protein [Pseudofrankia inefficax]|uniref:Alcohol dehydrogenase zinc-binding domain protein n=1 Tax=Pseudofrankia inefficax (strain DSM 45817 / CECT 9037 / DDB 130130 / EuI1c) TaxID=298654 RepID=E3J3P3_PSEI1|nr:zinc-binding dehydrogenase [Pseudofrankia inefficax]ADP79380.1 Alcohol dehydrogenase zinc-binding domain protein [Pseudofrankia inefficax]
MRTVILRDFGGPDVLRLAETPAPEPGPGQVRIAVEAVSVGFAQTQMRQERFPAPMWRPTLPVVLGGDVVGVIDRLGPGVAAAAGAPRIGDRVGVFVLHGGYAERVVADIGGLVPIPADLDPAVATLLPGTGPIAAGLLDIGRLQPGESVLVHAAAGGIGHVALQLARRAGAGLIVATAGSPAKREFARSLGADVVVDYTQDGWPDRVRAATGGRGVDLILDGVGGNLLRAGVGLLAPLGRLVYYGSSDGGLDVPSISTMDLIGLKFVTGFALSAWRAARPTQFQAGLADLTAALRTGGVTCEVHARLPLSGAAEGHRIVESRAYRGRVVLLPSLPDADTGGRDHPRGPVLGEAAGSSAGR